MTFLTQVRTGRWLVVDGNPDDILAPTRLLDSRSGRVTGLDFPLGSWLNHLGGDDGPWTLVSKEDLPADVLVLLG